MAIFLTGCVSPRSEPPPGRAGRLHKSLKTGSKFSVVLKSPSVLPVAGLRFISSHCDGLLCTPHFPDGTGVGPRHHTTRTPACGNDALCATQALLCNVDSLLALFETGFPWTLETLFHPQNRHSKAYVVHFLDPFCRHCISLAWFDPNSGALPCSCTTR
jgi:hypothetical protein